PTLYISTTSSGGCVHHDTVFVVTRTLPDASFTMDSALCEGAITSIVYSGGAGNDFQFIWDFGNANVQSGSGSGPYQASWDTIGIWTVILNVTDHFDCNASDTEQVIVNPSP